MFRILVVCMGNICRSPMAQTIASQLAHGRGLGPKLQFDSAGTHAMTDGMEPDPRAKSALERKGYEMARRRARRLVEQDFEYFDLILGMDRQNLADLQHASPAEHAHKLHLFLDFAPGLKGQEVPDPYFGNLEGFERVLELCEAGARGLLDLHQI